MARMRASGFVVALHAPGVVAPGTPGSFTAQVFISGSVAADTPNTR